MKRLAITLWGALAPCLTLTGAALQLEEEGEQVRVIEDRLALYAVSNSASEVVAWLPRGVLLTVRGELTEESWVQVYAPPDVTVWLYRDLVRDGVVTARRSQMRAGPGMNYPVLADLKKGDRVRVIARYGDWLKIKPPAGTLFWALRAHLEPARWQEDDQGREALNFYSEVLTALTNAPAETTTSPAGALASPRLDDSAGAGEHRPHHPPQAQRVLAPPPELTGLPPLDTTLPQGRQVALRGWLAPGIGMAPYRLIAAGASADPTEAAHTLCHLQAGEGAFAAYLKREVTVTGTLWHLQGSAISFIVPFKVQVDD